MPEDGKDKFSVEDWVIYTTKVVDRIPTQSRNSSFLVVLLSLIGCEPTAPTAPALTPYGTPLIWKSDLSSTGPAEHGYEYAPDYRIPTQVDVETFCEKEWPDDFRMQEYCQERQFDGVKKVLAYVERYQQSGNVVGTAILKNCDREWPEDFAMRAYCIERQEEAAERLGKL